MISLDTTNLLRSMESVQLLEVKDALRLGPLASDPLADAAIEAIRGELCMRGNSRKGKGRPPGTSHRSIFATKTDGIDSHGGANE